MIDFLFALAVLSLALWGLMDIYFTHLLFDPIREFGKKWSRSRDRNKKVLGYGLTCRYCLSHWAALVLIVLILKYPSCLAIDLSTLDAFLLLVITPRLALVLHDYLLPPLRYEDTQDKNPDGE
jgi:hypothetical protein